MFTPTFVPTLCSNCHQAAYDYEPQMGDPDFVFAPGTCSNTQNHPDGDWEGIVWFILS